MSVLTPINLPILEKRAEILAALAKNQVIVVAGETGSGKTTQLPKFLREAGYADKRPIAVTQPRRIAATSLARRVADELATTVGDLVGYRIRFDERYSKQSQIIFMTDGMLLNDIQRDPVLNRYGAIIIDEAHERSLNIDFLLGYLRRLMAKRPDLKVIISSATINTQLFSDAFNNAPIIEVSGRLFPVDTIYLPPVPAMVGEGEEATYIDAAVAAVNMVVEQHEPGDILIFMPTERDILETVNALKGLSLDGSEVMPLFARLTAEQQNRIFAGSHLRKIIVSTNIAETSLTIPGIRFVVDSGLARISRYAPRLRTNRLPVERIARASADQRKGRCGRVADGICFRLYEAEDFAERPLYTTPEIRRSNLAGTILSMLSMRLGDIREFPFVEPPADRAVSEGYRELFELGAINKEDRLTPLGKRMSTLPLSPHISKMLFEAEKEGVVRDVSIIAAGLSIVDPRERPQEKKGEAEAQHKKFVNLDSDFLTLLKLWDTCQEEWGALKTQGKIRRFCKEHFLNFNRMTEWHEVHHQIITALRSDGIKMGATRSSDDGAIHRAVLSGLLSNIAKKKKEGGYTAARGRELALFPGSVLYKKEPEWIVCHEVVETSRVFGRTAAPIDVRWIEQIAPHLCSKSYSDPMFEIEGGFVAAKETVSYLTLAIMTRRVNYARIDPDKANDIFIREGLIDGLLNVDLPFLNHNDALLNEVETTEAKLRTRGLLVDTETLYRFYKNKMPDIATVNDLRRIIREKGGDTFLKMTEADVLAYNPPAEATAYPDALDIGGKSFPLVYTFEPGSAKDGITVSIPAADAPYINKEIFGWLVPALWAEKITALIKTLPKNLRKNFVPAPEHGKRLAEKLTFKPTLFTLALCQLIKKEYGFIIDPQEFKEADIESHLRMRVSVIDKKGKEIVAGRDLDIAKTAQESHKTDAVGMMEKAFAKFERQNVDFVTIPELDPRKKIGTAENGFDLFAWPAFTVSETGVDLKYYPDEPTAQEAHYRGVQLLLENRLAEDLAWLTKQIKCPQNLKLLLANFGGAEKMQSSLIAAIRAHAITLPFPAPRTESSFEEIATEKRKFLTSAGNRAVDIIYEALAQFPEIRAQIDRSTLKFSSKPYHDLKRELLADLSTMVTDIAEGKAPWELIAQLHRSVRAFRFRAERAFADLVRYQIQHQKLAHYVSRTTAIVATIPRKSVSRAIVGADLALKCNEFAISLFAQQEVKTLFSVSEKRMDEWFEAAGRFGVGVTKSR